MEWWIFKSDEFFGMTNIQEWQNLENDKLSGMTNFWVCQIFENEEFSGMMDFLEWWIFGNQESLEWQIFGNDDVSGQGISIIKSKKKSKRFWWLLKLKNILFSINITAIGCWQVLSLSVVQMKGKHCQKPHGLDGIVDGIVHYMKYCF